MGFDSDSPKNRKKKQWLEMHYNAKQRAFLGGSCRLVSIQLQGVFGDQKTKCLEKMLEHVFGIVVWGIVLEWKKMLDFVFGKKCVWKMFWEKNKNLI